MEPSVLKKPWLLICHNSWLHLGIACVYTHLCVFKHLLLQSLYYKINFQGKGEPIIISTGGVQTWKPRDLSKKCSSKYIYRTDRWFQTQPRTAVCSGANPALHGENAPLALSGGEGIKTNTYLIPCSPGSWRSSLLSEPLSFGWAFTVLPYNAGLLVLHCTGQHHSGNWSGNEGKRLQGTDHTKKGKLARVKNNNHLIHHLLCKT